MLWWILCNYAKVFGDSYTDYLVRNVKHYIVIIQTVLVLQLDRFQRLLSFVKNTQRRLPCDTRMNMLCLSVSRRTHGRGRPNWEDVAAVSPLSFFCLFPTCTIRLKSHPLSPSKRCHYRNCLNKLLICDHVSYNITDSLFWNLLKEE